MNLVEEFEQFLKDQLNDYKSHPHGYNHVRELIYQRTLDEYLLMTVEEKKQVLKKNFSVDQFKVTEDHILRDTYRNLKGSVRAFHYETELI